MGRFPDKILILSFFLGVPFLAACNSPSADRAAPIESMYTDISPASCTEHIDQDDPNDSTFQLCPGVLGYSLVLRLVGSGRQSVDVRTPANGDFPLDYDEFVTRHMSQLGTQAEWRVMNKNGQKTPIALIVPVKAHENADEPEEITITYLALAKITPDEICVTHKMVDAAQSQSVLHDHADMAAATDCLAAQPNIAIDGEIVD